MSVATCSSGIGSTSRPRSPTAFPTSSSACGSPPVRAGRRTGSSFRPIARCCAASWIKDEAPQIADYFSKVGLTNAQISALLVYGDEPIDIELPTAVTLVVAQTDPGLKGDTASGATKPATLETGLVVNVPLFINIGDKLKVDTRTGEYVERMN